MIKYVQVERSDILSLISCATDYGFANSVLFSALADWLGPVADQEISDYARKVGSKPGYGEEDVEQITERLTEWRDKYGSEA